MYGRRVYLGEWSEVGPEQGRTTLTPNANAARTLGVEPLSLETLARQILGDERIAHPLIVQRLLRQAVEEAVGKLRPRRGGAHPASSDKGAVPRRRRRRRRSGLPAGEAGDGGRPCLPQPLLRGEGLIDPAEALWEAAQASPERRPVLVWGYPRLGRDEVAFIDAVAGEGSVVRLPYAEDHTFDENRETAEELERRGWAIDARPSASVLGRGGARRGTRLPSPRGRGTGGSGPGQGPPRRRRPAAEDIVLVARDDASYGPTVLSVAQEYGVPVQALYQVPALRHQGRVLAEPPVRGDGRRVPVRDHGPLPCAPLGSRHPERALGQGA